jgi:Cu-processing system ATP-binding protein
MQPSTPAPTLAFRGLTKRYGKRTVLDRLELDLTGGRVTALLGPNGAGKTTLLKCLLGLVHPSSGDILIDGRAVDRAGAYRHGIGFMPQLPHFPPHMTGRELVTMLDDLRDFRGRPDEELIDAFDLGPDMDKPFRTLSGGTRQKVNAALAFRYRAPVMVLDEPTAGLDPVASLALKEKVRSCRARGCTVVVTSHNMGDLEALADEVIFLHEGRIRFAGGLDELLRNTGRASLEAAIADLMRGEPAPGTPESGDEESGDAAQRIGDGDGKPRLRVEVA